MFGVVRQLGVALVFLLMASFAFGQTPGRFHFDRHSFEFESWTKADGLPQDSVNCMEQTADGYLWVGTFGGLARFDGHTFRRFHVSNTPLFPSNRILSLEESKNGGLWIGTQESGLAFLKDGEIQFALTIEKVGSISFLKEDRDGVLWIGGTSGLYSLQDGHLVSGHSWRVFDLKLDAEGQCWEASVRGLARLSAKSRTIRYSSKDLLRIIQFDVNGKLWAFGPETIATLDHGALIKRSYSFGFDPRAVVFFDRGEFAIASPNSLSLFTLPAIPPTGGVTVIGPPRQILRRSVRIRSLHCDGAKNIWIGTNEDGLIRARAVPFQKLKLAYGNGTRRSAKRISTGIKGPWVTADGAVLLNWAGREFAPVQVREDGKIIRSSILVGSIADGSILLWNGKAIKRVRDEQVVASTPLEEMPTGLSSDDRGRFWTGIKNAVVCMSEGQTFHIPVANTGQIRVKRIDPGRKIWFLYANGIGNVKDGYVTTYPIVKDAGGPCRDMVRDKNGDIWIATYGRGLIRFREGAFFSYGPNEGMKELCLGGLLVEGDVLWVNSNSGAFKLSIANLNKIAAGDASRVSMRLYETGECNGPDIVRGPQGRIWLPTMSGVTVLNAKGTESDRIRPRVFVETITVDRDISTISNAEVVIEPGRRDIEFGFTGTTAGLSSRVTFLFRLIGHVDEWVDADVRRSAYFSDLAPGSYTFEVVAVNGSGLRSAESAKVTLRVLPFYYQTTWFRVLVVGLIAALVWGLFNLRLRAVQRKNEDHARIAEGLRETRRLESVGRLANGIAHDFNNVLTAILGSAELLGRAPQVIYDSQLTEHVDMLEDCAARGASLVRQLLAFSRQQVLLPMVFEVDEVIGELKAMLERLLPDDVRLTTDLNAKGKMIDADRTQIEQVVMNLILNARDAMPNGGTIVVATRVEQQAIEGEKGSSQSWLEIAVTDTGRGISRDVLPRIFEPFYTTKDESHGTGLGLASVQGIVLQSKGLITVDSDEGVGTTFRVLLPLVGEEEDLDDVEVHDELKGSGNIIICQSDEQWLIQMRKSLEAHGYHVRATMRPLEAMIVAMDCRHLDLLIVGGEMPQVGAGKLSDSIKKRHQGLQTLHLSSPPKAEGLPAAGAVIPSMSPRDLLVLVHEILEPKSSSTSNKNLQ